MSASPADVSQSATSPMRRKRSSRRRQWRRSAGVVAAVALLVVSPARSVSASPSAHQTTAAPFESSSYPSRFATLSSGSYTWHVASSTTAAQPDRSDDGGRGPLHGEFPVVAVDGTVQTRKWQFGRVVTVSDSWFAVTSDDGYSDRYLLDTSVTSTPVKVGQDVTVVGVIESTLSTAGAEPTERVV